MSRVISCNRHNSTKISERIQPLMTLTFIFLFFLQRVGERYEKGIGLKRLIFHREESGKIPRYLHFLQLAIVNSVKGTGHF